MRERTFVVAGGSGVAGECAVRALLGRGATVVVPSRSPDRLAELRAAIDEADLGRLHTVVADIGTPEGVAGFRDRVTDLAGPVDGVIASLGGWWEGAPLTEVPFEVWQRILRDNLTAHFLTAQAFLPLLAARPDGVYIALNGIAALKPVPLAGPISVTDAAQTMLLRTFAAEGGGAVRIHDLAVLTPIITRRWPAEDPIDPRWLSGETVGSYIADVADPAFPRKDRLRLLLPEDWDIWS